MKFIYLCLSAYLGWYIAKTIYDIKLGELKKENESWTSQYKKESKMYKTAYYNLLNEYNKVTSILDFYKRNSNNIHIKDDIKSALKFAMIYSHPDKGNCKSSDEFIKFKKLYDDYK